MANLGSSTSRGSDEASYLEQGRNYHALSVRDLLDARDAYHVFLTRQRNVIGTAIGKMRIRQPGVPRSEPKTLSNTEVRSYSWPCVMVFVHEWIAENQFGTDRATSCDDRIPPRLFLADGREIPTCVLYSPWAPQEPDPIINMRFPAGVVGGGYPILTRVQGEDRWATLGCLVSDGRLTYGLTNAHVTGRPGEPLLTIKNGNEVEIGLASSKQLEKLPFTKVYEGLPGTHCLATLDVGLIELHDLHDTSSQVFGLGELRGLADVNHDTVSLRLIGCPVKGFGCVSGELRGEVVGLFYRYDHAGGYDYVADYLIGPRVDEEHGATVFAPSHGDSGTLLVVDDAASSEHMKALAILWGGQRHVYKSLEQRYGLATNLGTICQQLDVRVVCDWNINYDRYFGAFAHVTLPRQSIPLVQNAKLRELLENNADYFGMPLDTTAPKATKGLSKAKLVPLPDVPDLVWKARGGKFQRGKEGPNHFADMDEPDPKKGRQTLLDLCMQPQNIDPAVWGDFYRDIKAREKGALPFRVAQIFDAMVNAASGGQCDEFVCAAGILPHYVFDAAMPLHISRLHHGDPDGEQKTVKQGGKQKTVPIAYDVHDEFDNQMIEYAVAKVRQRLPQLVAATAQENRPVPLGAICDTHGAADATVRLMRNTVQQHVDPAVIVREYEELLELSKRERCDQLFELHGEEIPSRVVDRA